MIRINSPRLRFRGWESKDFPEVADMFSNNHTARFLGGVKSREQSWRQIAIYIGHWHLNGFGYWAIEEKSRGKFVGAVGLWKSPAWPEMELGYWIKKEMQGNGYASEAGKRCKDYAFEELGVKTLVSYIHPENMASKKVSERLGGTYEKVIDLADFGSHEVYRYFPKNGL